MLAGQPEGSGASDAVGHRARDGTTVVVGDSLAVPTIFTDPWWPGLAEADVVALNPAVEVRIASRSEYVAALFDIESRSASASSDLPEPFAPIIAQCSWR